jgi:putative ABC transport system permease protein
VLRDLRTATRTLWRHRVSTLVTLIVLALGIGANAAIFGAIDAAFIRRLPFHAADRLVVLQGTYSAPSAPGPKLALDISDWAARPDIFSMVGSYGAGGLNLALSGAAERVRATRISTDFLAMLGQRPALGRDFVAADSFGGTARAVLVSDELWRSALHADPNAVGSSINLSGIPCTIVGVLPRGFAFPDHTDLWVAEVAGRDPLLGALYRTQVQWVALGRLADGVSMAQAQNRVDALERTFVESHPAAASRKDHVALVPLRDALQGGLRSGLMQSLAVALLLLLLAIANAAGLVLANSISRRREIAVRHALGATRGRIVRLLALEVSIMAIGGVTLGIVIGKLTAVFVSGLMPPDLVGLTTGGGATGALGFAAAALVVCVAGAGIFPAVTASDVDLLDSLKASDTHASSRVSPVRSGLVITQIAISSMLLVAASLLLQSVWRLDHVDKGFQTDGVVAIDVSLPSTQYRSVASVAAFNRAAIDRLSALPGVASTGVVNILPLTGGSAALALQIEGRPAPSDPDERPRAEYLIASPGYFSTLRIPLLKGRGFTSADDQRAPHVALINKTMADRYWPGADPIGAQVKYPWDTTRYTVVGVVGSVRDVRLQDADHWPGQIYFPVAQTRVSTESFVVRTLGRPDPSVPTAVRRAVQAVAPSIPPFNVRPLAAVVAESIASMRTTTFLTAAAGLLGLLIATGGLYGIVTEGIERRSREIGIRIALGANPSRVVALVLQETGRLVAIAIPVGVVLSLAAARLLSHLLYEVQATDLTTFVAVPTILLMVAIAASIGGILGAMRVDPVHMLRAE